MLEFRDKGTSRTQFAVMSGEVVIATVYKAMPSAMVDQPAWNWSFKATDGPPGFQQHGTAASFDKAKAAVEAQWARWLAAAGLRVHLGDHGEARGGWMWLPPRRLNGSHRLQGDRGCRRVS